MRFVVDYMSKNPVMVGTQERARWAESEAQRREVHHVIVTDGDGVAGVVSVDELKAAPPDALVEQVMSRNLIFVSDQATVSEAERLMDQYDVDCLPVMRWDELIVGVITRGDVTRNRPLIPCNCSACGEATLSTPALEQLGLALCASCEERSHPPKDSFERMYTTLGNST